MSIATAAEKIESELSDCMAKGNSVLLKVAEEEVDDEFRFEVDYQQFYSDAIRLIAILGPERGNEFRGYYEIDPKRKGLDYSSYVIQDYVKNIVPSHNAFPNFNAKGRVTTLLIAQLSILKSYRSRIDGVLSNVTGGLLADLQDAELVTARTLMKASPRAAGALAGVVLEGHLQQVCGTHKVTMRKKNPTISDLNDPLKAAGIYDVPTWRKVSYLADIRNICCHSKGDEPTKNQVVELIEGVNWAIKSIV